MFGKNARINRFAAQKQLLIAASELNRAHLVQDWQLLTSEVHALAGEARLLRSCVSTAATLVTGLVAFRRKKAATGAEKPSWLRTILQGAGKISHLWTLFSAPPPAPRNK